MSTLMQRLHLQRTHDEGTADTGPRILMRGGMGEPYCSQACYAEGGAAITRDMIRGMSEVPCHVCNRALDFGIGTPTSMVYLNRIPRYFHQTPVCDGAIREEAARLTCCVMCGAPIPELVERWNRFETTFGKDLSARLLRALGAARALSITEDAVARAAERWRHRFEEDFLNPEQREQRSLDAAKSHTLTVETRAAFLVSWDAQLVAGDAAREAIAASGLPQDDQDLYLDFGASILRTLH